MLTTPPLLVAVALARWLGSADEALRGTIAIAIVVPLTAVSLAVSGKVFPRGFVWQFGVVLGGSGLRIALTLATAGVCAWALQTCANVYFWLWLAAAYALTLSVEVILLIQLLEGMKSASLAVLPEQVDTGL